MRITFSAGLVLRHGQRTLELVRQLNSDEYQFEDCLTRRPIVLNCSTLTKRIWDNTYEVLVGTDASSKERGAPLALPNSVDLQSLGQQVRAGIERRMHYVKAAQKAHIGRGQRARIEKLIPTVAKRIKDKKPPSASSVMTWIRNYQNANHNPLALRNGNTMRVRRRRTHPLMDEIVKRNIIKVYLTRSRNSLQHTLRLITREARQLVSQKKLEDSEATYSLSSLSRRVKEIDLFRRIAAREGHARARMVCRTVMDGAGAAYPLQRVEADHTPLNWIVVCDRTGLPLGRPLLTVIIDSYSNYVLGIYISFYGPGISSLSGVLRNAIMPKDQFVSGLSLQHPWLASGVPDEIIVDNGLEFHASVFKLMAWELASDLTYCRVRTPWLKPHVERFFATLDYLSLNRGRIHKRVANVMNIDPRKDAAIKFSDLVKGLVMFVADVHPFEINERKLARPYDLLMEGLEYCPPASFPLSFDNLRLTTALSKTTTLGPGGIELRGLPYGRQELLPLRKRYGQTFKVQVKWDPDNMSHIWIRHPEEEVWIQSPCRWFEYANGLSWNQHLIIRNFTRRELKLKGAHEDLMQAHLRLHDFWMEATSYKTSADAKLAAKFSGATSAKVMAPPSDPESPVSLSTTAIADIEIPQAQPSIPDFESFVMP